MGKPNPEIVARWIEEDCRELVFQPLTYVIDSCLKQHIEGYSIDQISELAEGYEKKIGKLLQDIISNCIEDGKSAGFEVFQDEDTRYYFKALPVPELSFLKKLRASSPDGFERFCSKILQKLNASAEVTGGSQDGGVDFLAFGLPFDSRTHPMPRPAKAVVVGQSKRYSQSNQVGEAEVRTFVGGAIKKLHDLRMDYPDKFGILTPTVLAFWTTGEFSIPARKYAHDLGLWHLNGIGIAQLAGRLELGPEDVDASEREADAVKSEKLKEKIERELPRE